jgi:hypothetical protein
MHFTLPSWLSWYKKPEYRDIKEYSTSISTGKCPLSPDGRNEGIPSRLRLERILANKTCQWLCCAARMPCPWLTQWLTGSPMSLYDFYMYLKYIEHSEENLEFYMWCVFWVLSFYVGFLSKPSNDRFKNYEATYNQAFDDKDCGSIRSAAQSTSSVVGIKPEDSLDIQNGDLKEEDDDGGDEAGTLSVLAMYSSLLTAHRHTQARETLSRISQLISTTALCTSKSTPCFFQPPSGTTTPKFPIYNQNQSLTTELSTVISLFLLPNSPKELNIPSTLRVQVLSNLHNNTITTSNSSRFTSNPPPHPSALKPVADHVYSLLRNCSHRNFVRLGVGNGTFETVCVATVLGWTTLAAGFLLVLCRGLLPHRGSHSRWEAFAAWPLWCLGMSLVLSGLRGSCFFLLLFSRRQRLPWERFDDDGSPRRPSRHEEEAGEEVSEVRFVRQGGEADGDGDDVNGRDSIGERGRKRPGGLKENKQVVVEGGAAGQGKGGFGLVRSVKRLMIFDQRVKVQERHLRRLQRKIVLQSLVGGSLFATVCVAVFICLPVWRETV